MNMDFWRIVGGKPFPPRAFRRLLVVVFYLLIAGCAIGWLVIKRLKQPLLPGVVVAIAFYVLLMYLVFRLNWLVLPYRPPAADERMHAIWDRAWRRAGWASVMMFQAALMYDYYALGSRAGGIHVKVTASLLLWEVELLSLAAICLPAAIILWTEVDLPPERQAQSAP
jgi:hypothetical protein